MISVSEEKIMHSCHLSLLLSHSLGTISKKRGTLKYRKAGSRFKAESKADTVRRLPTAPRALGKALSLTDLEVRALPILKSFFLGILRTTSGIALSGGEKNRNREEERSHRT
jgi:hypothetical protein